MHQPIVSFVVDLSLAIMAVYMSSDIHAAEDSEGVFSGFCCMHVINAHGRAILLSGKSAAKWKEVEGSSKSKVAAVLGTKAIIR